MIDFITNAAYFLGGFANSVWPVFVVPAIRFMWHAKEIA